jgi:hypothetical protein
MQAEARSKPKPGTLTLGGATGHELVAIEGPGLTRLALMVDTVFDRLTSVDDGRPQPSPSG